ncbi:MAG: hypothetical protein NTW86_24800 [Candidatus Sumerlaeota bacterium]|nr:hypothetical protein [Candidatus Sumerlaeota bacterium]
MPKANEKANKDAALFPETLDGRPFMLYRPAFELGKGRYLKNMHLGVSESLEGPWTDCGILMRPFHNPTVQSTYMGAGSVPFSVGNKRYLIIYFNTIMGIVEAETPKGVQESYDVLSIAERGGASPRRLAISGQSAHTWERSERPAKFTVFDDEWYLLVGLKAEDSQLFRYGALPNVALEQPKTMADLREKGLREIERRGASPALVEWLRSGGKSEFPEVRRPEPEGWTSYWGQNYQKW